MTRSDVVERALTAVIHRRVSTFQVACGVVRKWSDKRETDPSNPETMWLSSLILPGPIRKKLSVIPLCQDCWGQTTWDPA